MSAAPPTSDSSSPSSRLSSLLLWLLCVPLLVCAACFVVMTRHWPMVGDAALMHYTVFLLQHGWAPYRDFTDINMPGAYGMTALGMQLPGQPDINWRVFDLLLIALAGVAYYAIARPYSRFAALFATVLLLLIHGQDGVQQAGQRDEAIAALLLLAVAALLESVRRNQSAYVVVFGIGIGLAATIKPTALPLGMVLLAMAVANRAGWLRDAPLAEEHETPPGYSRGRALRWTAIGLTAMAAPLLGMLGWLVRWHALSAWLQEQRLFLPYYASLERRPFHFTLSHSISPLLPLVLVWLLCAVLRGPKWSQFERLLILLAVLINLTALLAQGKALPYQRYPMMAFLLLLIGLDLTTAWTSRHTQRRAVRYVALAGLCCGCLVIAPLAIVKVHRFRATSQEFDAMLRADLHKIPGKLDGRIQCLDTINDCLPTLYAMRLLPATGTLYDLYLFGPERQPAVRAARQQFLGQVMATPPSVFVVTSGSFLDQASDYSKLDTWPQFSQWLAAHYDLTVEGTPRSPIRWWSRPQPPASYRLYVLKVGKLDLDNPR